MANEIVNAVALRKNAEWHEWLAAVAAYTARLVINEDETTDDHEIRYTLAKRVAFNPESIVELLVTTISTDPEVCSIGDTPQLIGQELVLLKVDEVWTQISRLMLQ